MSARARTCFHCGEPIPAGVLLDAQVNGAAQPVCCIGCHAAAEWIAALGLQDYYRLRDVPAERAAPCVDYSAWDRAQLQRMYVRERGDGTAEVCVLVQGLRCAACSWLIDRALRELPGVTDVAVNVPAKRVQLVWRTDTTALSALLERLARLGYTPHPLNAEGIDALNRQETRTALKRLIVAGLGMMQSMMYAVALYAGAFEGMDPVTRDFFRWLGLLVCAPVVLYAGALFFVGAWRELHARRLGMDTPVALAIALVFVASVVETVRGGAQVYFDSASMFVFLLLSARYVEMFGRRRAADIVDALARLQPAIAQRRAPYGIETVGAHELEPGDIVVIENGATIPADGVLLGSASDVDESLLTGESTPRQRRAGDALVAGTILRSGPAELRVVHVGAQTVLSSIVRLVTQAQQQRPRWTQFGDALAARFIAGVLMLTAITAVAWLLIDPAMAFPASLAVLVVSCPCAFALSVPAATTRAIAALARGGVLVLKPDALEKLLALTHVVFDKTGTLTTQRMELVATQPLGRLSASECIALAGALERTSMHPIGQAIRAATQVCDSLTVDDARTVTGAGVEGCIEGHRYRIGRADFALAGNHHGDDGVLLADDRGALARFTFREHLRVDAVATLAALRSEGLTLEILSGDDTRAVADAARRLGIGTFHARVAPAQKLAHLQRLRAAGNTVGMVGDGVNDAPVLAGADVAIALGDGAQLAQSSADIVLAGDRLGALLDARRVARLTMRVLRQNTYWAIVYNFLSIPLAAAGLVPPWLAAIGMSASSLLVVLNSLRIRAPVPRVRRESAPVSSINAQAVAA
jgi:Cu2+-exporting ATPase